MICGERLHDTMSDGNGLRCTVSLNLLHPSKQIFSSLIFNSLHLSVFFSILEVCITFFNVGCRSEWIWDNWNDRWVLCACAGNAKSRVSLNDLCFLLAIISSLCIFVLFVFAFSLTYLSECLGPACISACDLKGKGNGQGDFWFH